MVCFNKLTFFFFYTFKTCSKILTILCLQHRPNDKLILNVNTHNKGGRKSVAIEHELCCPLGKIDFINVVGVYTYNLRVLYCSLLCLRVNVIPWTRLRGMGGYYCVYFLPTICKLWFKSKKRQDGNGTK